jgi:hypothetical protein
VKKQLRVLALIALLASAVFQVAPAAAAGTITGITINPSAKVHIGDTVTVTVQGTGFCAFRLDVGYVAFVGQTFSDFPGRPLPTTYSFPAVKEGAFSLTAKSVDSRQEYCSGTATAKLTVLPPPRVRETMPGPSLAVGPGVQRTPIQPLGAQKPDLACTLSAANPTVSGTPPIADGATVNIGEASNISIDVWFSYAIKNVGKGSVDKPFAYTVQRKLNGALQGTGAPKTVTPPVAPDETKVSLTMMVPVPIGTSTHEVTINVDSQNQIDEATDANNVCHIKITTVRKGSQPQVTFASSLYAIYSHQRCVNCHGAVNEPAGTNHGGGANPNCVSCHTQPPGWKHAGAPSFVGKNAAALCELAKGSGHVNSSLTQWAFTGSIDDATKVSLPAKLPHDVVPGGHAAFVQKWKAWETAGKPCP